jgi:hypothetical protein
MESTTYQKVKRITKEKRDNFFTKKRRILWLGGYLNQLPFFFVRSSVKFELIINPLLC